MESNPKFPGLSLGLPIEPLFDAVPPEKRRLGLFLLFAALAHLLAFYFIQVSYPQPGLKSVSRTHVTLAPAASTVGVRSNLQFWYSLEDPSLLIRPQGPLIDTEKMVITPMISSPEQSITSSPVREDNIAFLPDGLPPLAERASSMLETPRQTFVYPSIISAPQDKPSTTLVLDPALNARLTPGQISLPSQPSGLLTESGVTILRVGINSEGRVLYVLTDQSCGKASVDALAVQTLRRTLFQPDAKQPLTWGQVTVYWQFEPETTPATTPPASPTAKP